VARWLQGYRLVFGLIGLSVLAIAVGPLSSGFTERGLRQATRWTVGIGAVVFVFAFVASSANTLLRSTFTKWLLRNRRYVGLGFGGIHLVHAACFLTLAFLYPASFWRTTSMVSIVGGSVGYVWLLAMIATSFDRTTRAIGRRAWTILHKSGMYVLWGILVFSYVGRLSRSSSYAAMVALLGSALVLRVAARVRNHVRSSSRARSAVEPATR
jgi:methionine sulfoxide reductase heme-binding subunit